MSKVTKAELYRNIARAIERDALNLLPEFPERFYSVDTSPGVRLYLREKEEGVVEYVHENYLAHAILKWVNNSVVGRFSDYQLDFKNAVEATRVWRCMATPVEVKNISWPGEAGLAFRRMPWPLQSGAHPCFDELMSRISNSHALKCFIGSLLNENSDMQQYVWLHGKGENGKGSLSRFLHKVLGDAYSSQTPPQKNDKFWTSMLLGKRLVVFPDCNDQEFVTSGLFKSLTGGDPVRCEQKMQPAFTRIMTAKYMPISNNRPNLTSEKADQRRIIYCEIGAIECDADPEYETRLWAEGGPFLTSCMIAYAEACPKNGKIPVDKNDSALTDWVSTVEEKYETIFEQNFELDSNSYILPVAMQDRLNEVLAKDARLHGDFRMWLERSHGIKKATEHKMTGTPKVYRGVRLVPWGHAVRDSQQRQYDLQRKWDKQRDGGGRRPGHLKTVETVDRDNRDD